MGTATGQHLTAVVRLHSDGAAETEHIGRRLARSLRPGMRVHLQGELGAGKTTLVRGILRGLGYDGLVKSPTYTLVEPYLSGAIPVCHLDLYRLRAAEELESLGIRDHLDGRNLLLVEWPERAGARLGPADLSVEFSAVSGDQRDLVVQAGSAAGAGAVESFCADLSPSP